MVGVWPRHQRVLKAAKAEDHYIGKTHFLLLLIDLKKVLASLHIVPNLLYRITRFSSLENLVMRYIFQYETSQNFKKLTFPFLAP